MASESYPASLPGVLVQSNAYSPQSVVRRNELQAGAPTFRLVSDTAYEMFDVMWSFSASEMQLFDGWHKWGLRSGSKSFDIELMVYGFNGTKNTRTHECYFADGTFKSVQAGARWHVSASLLSIVRETDSEAFYNQLVILSEGFPDGIRDTINALEELVEINIGGCLHV